MNRIVEGDTKHVYPGMTGLNTGGYGQNPMGGEDPYSDLMRRLEKMLRDVGYQGGFGSLLRQLVGNNILPGRGGDQIGGGGNGGNGGGGGGGGCLCGDVMVALYDGTEKPARDIKVDDILIGIDPELGAVPQVVTCTNSSRQPCVSVLLSDGRSITASTTHNWFTVGGIVPTFKLQPGDLLIASKGDPLSVAAINEIDPQVVHWWNCDPNHNFFAGGVLHHNVTASQTKDPILVPGAGYQPPVVGGTGGSS